MNKVLATPKGMVLLLDKDYPQAEITDVAKQLQDSTGMTWAVLNNSEYVEPKALDIQARLDRLDAALLEIKRKELDMLEELRKLPLLLKD